MLAPIGCGASPKSAEDIEQPFALITVVDVMQRAASIAIALFILASTANAQPKKPDLYNQVLQLDAQMFDAFNAHDISRLMQWFSKDVEFYHDTGGLQFFADLEKGFPTLFKNSEGIRRELLKETLEVYPIGSYGAIETGSHRFCHVENGKNDCGTFKFVQVWKNDKGAWHVTRVLSYGH